MKEIRRTSQFKKDFKRDRNNKAKVEALFAVLQLLQQGQPLPEKYKAHILTGNLQGVWECHIESDYLLLWIDETLETVVLMRLGSHSEVLGL